MATGSGVGTPISGGVTTSQYDLTWLKAIPKTMLPITRYAQIMGIPLPHFWQQNGAKAPQLQGCDSGIWDQDARLTLAEHIIIAEQMISEFLDFYPIPWYTTDEEVELYTPIRTDWWNAPVTLNNERLIELGTESLSLIQADAPVGYSNLNNNPLSREDVAIVGGGIYGEFSGCSDNCAVAVFFRTEDGAPSSAHPDWEVKPIRVERDPSGVFSIKINSAQLIRPELLTLTEYDCMESDEPSAWIYDFSTSNLVTKVDVYCRSTNGNLPATLIWDPTCSSSISNVETQNAAGVINDRSISAVTFKPAVGANQIANPSFAVSPLKIKVNYLSGYPLGRNCQMDPRLEMAIVKLTNVLLPEPPCSYCGRADLRWRDDRMNIDPLSLEATNLVWGLYQRGALEAWKLVRNFLRVA